MTSFLLAKDELHVRRHVTCNNISIVLVGLQPCIPQHFIPLIFNNNLNAQLTTNQFNSVIRDAAHSSRQSAAFGSSLAYLALPCSALDRLRLARACLRNFIQGHFIPLRLRFGIKRRGIKFPLTVLVPY